MWTKKENENLLPNMIVKDVYKDGILKHYQLFPKEGYVIICPSLDTEIEIEDGTIEKQQYISDGGITVSKDYDFSTSEFIAVHKDVYIKEEEKV